MLAGCGISSDRMPAFLREVEEAARRHGAVPLDELFDDDEDDASLKAASERKARENRRESWKAGSINLSEGEFEIL